MGSARNSRQRLLVVATAVALVALVAWIAPAGVLMLSPAIALVVLIGLGLFPSEVLIARIRRRLSGSARRVIAPALQYRPVLRRPTGVSLAFALAVRPPPRGALLPIA